MAEPCQQTAEQRSVAEEVGTGVDAKDIEERVVAVFVKDRSDPVGEFPWQATKVECELPNGKPGYCDEDGKPLE